MSSSASESFMGAPGMEQETPLYTAALDLSDRRHAEALFRRLLEATPNGVIIADGQGKILVVNAQVERLFGYSREELLGRPVEVVIPHRFRGKHDRHIAGYRTAPGFERWGPASRSMGSARTGAKFPAEIASGRWRWSKGCSS